MLDSLDSLTFDFSDTGGNVESSFPSSLANTPFELAAKLSCHQSFAYSQSRTEANQKDIFRQYDPIPDEVSPNVNLLDSEPMQRQFYSQSARQNVSDPASGNNYCQVGPPVFDSFGAYQEQSIIPDLVNSSFDCSFMESSLTDSNVDYTDQFPVLDNHSHEAFRAILGPSPLQQPVPRKPESESMQRHRPHTKSTPTSTTSSILTPVSSVADEGWHQFPSFTTNMNQYGNGQVSMRNSGHSSHTPSNGTVSNSGTRNVFRSMCARSFARTPESPMCRLKHHYLNGVSVNKAEVAISKAKAIKKSSVNGTNSPYGAANTTFRATLAVPVSAPSRPGSMLSLKSASISFLTSDLADKSRKRERKEPSPKRLTTQKRISSPKKDTSILRVAEPARKKHKRRHTQKRSRLGCWICRIKHLKCDETRPCCNHCRRFGVACDYNPERPNYVSDKELRRKKLDELSAQRRRNKN